MSFIDLTTLDFTILATILVLSASACLQAAVGFAAGLMGVPLLLWVGNSLPEAQILIITAMLPSNALALWKLRSHTSWKEVAAPALIRIAFLPVGVFGLAWLVESSSTLVQPLLGLIVLAAVAVQTLGGQVWQTADRPIWVAATFGLSGILQGISGMSAPPMLLWIHGQRFSANRARSFLFAMYLSNFIPQLALMLWTFGPGLWKSVLLAVVALPGIMIGSALGLKIGGKLSDKWLRQATYVVLVWLAIACLLDPWL